MKRWPLKSCMLLRIISPRRGASLRFAGLSGAWMGSGGHPRAMTLGPSSRLKRSSGRFGAFWLRWPIWSEKRLLGWIPSKPSPWPWSGPRRLVILMRGPCWLGWLVRSSGSIWLAWIPSFAASPTSASGFACVAGRYLSPPTASTIAALTAWPARSQRRRLLLGSNSSPSYLAPSGFMLGGAFSFYLVCGLGGLSCSD